MLDIITIMQDNCTFVWDSGIICGTVLWNVGQLESSSLTSPIAMGS